MSHSQVGLRRVAAAGSPVGERCFAYLRKVRVGGHVHGAWRWPTRGSRSVSSDEIKHPHRTQASEIEPTRAVARDEGPLALHVVAFGFRSEGDCECDG